MARVTAVAVLVLALGIGATTAMFSVIEGVLLRRLPFPAANRLVQIIQMLPSESSEPVRAGLTTEQVRALQSANQTLSVPGFFGPTSMNLTGTDVPAHLYGAWIAPGLFGKLSLAPLRAASSTSATDNREARRSSCSVTERGSSTLARTPTSSAGS